MSKKEIDDLIKEWLNGNELVFRHILEYYYRRLLTTSLKIVGNREDAEELVMNVLLKIWQRRHQLSEVVQFDRYLFGILRREVSGLFRKQVLPTEYLDTQPQARLIAVDHPELTFKEIRVRYLEALEKLTPRQRKVFLSIREHDMSRKETAEKNGMSLNTVNSHMHAALKILRHELKDYVGLVLAMMLVLC